MNLPAAIFKAYDIRGIVDQTLTEEGVLAIGQALGLLMHQQGQGRCVVGRDGRLSGPRLVEALTAGLTQAGIDVIQIGMVPTPVVYFATHELQTGTGVAITGSHNPPNYNGLKMMVAGTTLSGEAIQALYQSIVSGESQAHADRVKTGGRLGQVSQADVRQAYLDRIVSDVKWARPMRVAIDAGNGVAGELAPQLMKRLGADLTSLFCEVDGHFPNHHPDPADPHNLEDLIAAVAAQDLELGLAFDGDGDRLGVVTRSGKIIWPDRQLMLYAADVLAQQPGAQVIFDVKCSRQLAQHIKAHGGEPLMWRTGHSLIKAKLKET
ncbi:MAG: phosphomannomutase/phosphoglucomutase, partial [Burkholderiaceae bacterium]